jgi:serine/threonine protein kinase/tetratricopeptide (TPR) repeat protein
MSRILDPRPLRKDPESERTHRFSEAEIFTPQAPSTEEALPLPTIAGYEVVAVLGRGGFGVVYKAIQVKVKRLVALKMILGGAHASSSDLARFRAEAEAVGNLQHPNIVQIFEVGEQDGHSFFSLEYIAGGSLEQKLQRAQTAPRQAAHLVEVLARAIDYAHSNGIIHRDLKPANVLLTTDGTPKITDFGLAKRLDTEQGFTRTGAAVGTPAYMAPEQAMGQTKTLGPAVDIYALGAILYQLLTGRVPFTGDNPVDVMIRVATEEPVPPSRLLSKVPRDLETICLKCLEKEPHRRYRTAQALAEDLARFLNHEPILARPVTAWERSLKWMRRRKLVTALLASIALAVVALLASWGYYKHSESRHLDDACADFGNLIDQANQADRDQQGAKFETYVAKLREKYSSEPVLTTRYAEAIDKIESRYSAYETHHKFIQKYNRALTVAIRSTGEESEDKIHAGIREARDALAEVNLSDAEQETLDLTGPYTEAEKVEIRKGCYELLLFLADLVARQKGEANPQQAKQALQILGQAAKIGVRTEAFDQRRARYLKAAGSNPQSEKRTAVTADIEDPALDRFLMGDNFFKEGNYKSALEQFVMALQIQPDYFWARYYKAICHLALNQPVPARDCLTECLNQKRLVFIYLMRGYAEGQLAYAEGRLGHVEAQLYEYSAAEGDFQEALNRLGDTPDDETRYALFNNRAVIRLAQPEQFALGVEDLQTAIRVCPDKYHAYVTLAQALFKKGQLGEAIQRMDQAIQVAEDQVKNQTLRAENLALLYRSRSQFHLKREDGVHSAISDLKQAIAVDKNGSPSQAKTQIELGRLLQKENRLEEALAAYEVALKAPSEPIDAHRWQGETLFKLKRYAEAVQAFEQYLQKGGPATAKIYEARAMARGQLKDYAGAVEDYTRALTLEKEPKEITGILVNRGEAYLACQADLPALRDFDDALQRDSQNSTAYLGRGFARVRKGEIPEGIKDAEKAVQLENKNPKTTYQAARIFAQAAGKLDSDSERRNRETNERRFYYQDRAVALISRALSMLPDQQRERFWKENVAEDSALWPIRRTYGYSQLEEQYSPLKGRARLPK